MKFLVFEYDIIYFAIFSMLLFNNKNYCLEIDYGKKNVYIEIRSLNINFKKNIYISLFFIKKRNN